MELPHWTGTVSTIASLLCALVFLLKWLGGWFLDFKRQLESIAINTSHNAEHMQVLERKVTHIDTVVRGHGEMLAKHDAIIFKDRVRDTIIEPL